MENKMKYFLYLPVLVLGIYLTSCSELEQGIDQRQLTPNIHEEGILNPDSSNFHGKLISNNHWAMNQCQQCHGGNYAGGLVNVSCLTCHSQPAGPENCATCHGNETSPAPPSDLDGNTSSPKVGAHRIHLSGGLLGKKVSCTDCHNVPATVDTEGHVDSEMPAEIPMNGFLTTLVTNDPSSDTYNGGPLVVPQPSYNYSNFTCSNSYCHGNFKNGNNDNKPVWTNPSSAACGTCHGDPTKPTLFEKALPKTVAEGGSHIAVPPPPVGKDCSYCHGGVVDANLKFINVSKHIDGKLNQRVNDSTFIDVTF